MRGAADTATVRVIIEGRVQGVGFRWWVAQRAEARGLEGWVRNRRDGTVEALFHGPPDAVRRVIESCREGPPSARVRAVREYAGEPPDWPGFEQRPTV